MSEHAPLSHEQIKPAEDAPRHERHSKPEQPSQAEELQTQEVRQEVQEALTHHERAEKAEQRPPSAEAEPPHRISATQKNAAYRHTLTNARRDMSAPAKVFSKLIHQPAVEATSEIVGKTIARPTSILSGSLCAFLVMIGVYLLAKRNGFRLTGSEFIALFALGWVIGLVIDMFRAMFRSKDL